MRFATVCLIEGAVKPTSVKVLGLQVLDCDWRASLSGRPSHVFGVF
jgi:hypothetical protein